MLTYDCLSVCAVPKNGLSQFEFGQGLDLGIGFVNYLSISQMTNLVLL